MTIAIPLLDSTIAPLADSAGSWLIVSTQDENRRIVELRGFHPARLPEKLGEMGVRVVICNAVSPLLVRMLDLHEIQVSWGVRGCPDHALKCWKEGSLPGMGRCGRRRMRRFRGQSKER